MKSFKMIVAAALGLVCGFASQSQAGDRTVVVAKPKPEILKIKPSDLAAQEIASSLESFDTGKMVVVAFVKNVGGLTAPAGRVAKLEGKVLSYNPTTKKFEMKWVVRATSVIPALAHGKYHQFSTPHSKDKDYRLTISAGDTNPANDSLLCSQQPAPSVPH